MGLQKREQNPAVTPVEQRSWGEIGKWFAVHIGRWAVIGGVLYATGSALLAQSEDVIREPVAEQGALLNTTLEDKSKTIDEVATVAGEVDEQISSITEDWKELKNVLRDEFNIDIDKKDEPKDEAAQHLPPDTTQPTLEIGG